MLSWELCDWHLPWVIAVTSNLGSAASLLIADDKWHHITPVPSVSHHRNIILKDIEELIQQFVECRIRTQPLDLEK